MSKILIIYILLFSFIVLNSFELHGQDGQAETMLLLPKGAYNRYFDFMSLSDSDTPDFMKISAKGILGTEMLLDSRDSDTEPLVKCGTGFFIQTFRDDGKVCLCMAKHNLEGLEPSRLDPTLYSFDIFTQYLGRPSDNSFHATAVNVSGYKSFITARIVSSVVEDAVLLVVDPKLLSSSFTMLGYDFSPPVESGYYYFQGHPRQMHMRLANIVEGLKKPSAATATPNTYYASLSLASGNYIGVGSSGGPLIQRDLSSSHSVCGILTGTFANRVYEIPESEIFEEDKNRVGKLAYTDHPYFVSMAALERAIKRNCWKSKTEEELNRSGEYKSSVEVDMAAVHKSQYGSVQTIAGSAELAAAANKDYSTKNPGMQLVTGSTVTMTGNMIPAADIKVSLIVAPTITLGDTFSYQATGSNEMYFNSIALEPFSSSSGRSSSSSVQGASLTGMQTKRSTTDWDQVFIYPNPAKGKFSVHIPNGRAGRYSTLSVFNVTGAKVVEQPVTVGHSEVNISHLAEGIYIIRIVTEAGLICYSGKIIKQ